MSGRAGQARQLFRALAGNESAMRVVARQGLRRYHDKLHDLDADVEQQLAEVWDYEGQREWALDPETSVDPEAFRAVWDAINDRVLKLLVGSVTLIFGDPEASRLIEPEMRATLFELFLLAGNPETRYNLIAGLRPELRPIAAEQMEELGREAWGSLLALTADEIDPDEFPPATAANIQALAQMEADARGEALDGAGGGADD